MIVNGSAISHSFVLEWNDRGLSDIKMFRLKLMACKLWLDCSKQFGKYQRSDIGLPIVQNLSGHTFIEQQTYRERGKKGLQWYHWEAVQFSIVSFASDSTCFSPESRSRIILFIMLFAHVFSFTALARDPTSLQCPQMSGAV